MKTIFITISGGLTIRNILRTGVLSGLSQNKDLRIILLMINFRGIKLPEYLSEEFEKDNIKIDVLSGRSVKVGERIFRRLFLKNLVFSKSTKLYYRFHIKESYRKSGLYYFINWLIFYPLSKAEFLKKFCRKAYIALFSNNSYGKYFDKYRPDLVFSTSIVASMDADILKEAKRRGIKTVAMPRSWDNLDKFLLKVEPDLFLVQNEIMKKEAVKHQAFSVDKIKVVGFPQFDIYKDKSLILSRKKYCQSKNFNPDLPILFFGSEGAWSMGDDKIFGAVINAREQGLLPGCNILIRPHFSRCDLHNYHIFSKFRNVYIDDKYRKMNFFNDRWDPSREDMIDFTNSLYYSNIMITFASTLALDAACFNKPTIAIRYGVRFIDGEDRTHVMYETGHYSHVLETSAVSLVDSSKKLINKINYYFKNPTYKQGERQDLVNRLCYKVDGKSSERIVDSVNKLLNEHNI